jgi:hypothetical protein
LLAVCTAWRPLPLIHKSVLAMGVSSWLAVALLSSVAALLRVGCCYFFQLLNKIGTWSALKSTLLG